MIQTRIGPEFRDSKTEQLLHPIAKDRIKQKEEIGENLLIDLKGNYDTDE